MENIKEMSVSELSSFLARSGIKDEVVKRVKEEDITGDIFLHLSNENLKDVAPKLADRVRLTQLQERLSGKVY